MIFSELLLEWYSLNKRNLPWRDTNNAYFIWLSEIILQQTKVAQGLPYYLKFIKAFPTVNHLANASEEEVLKLWQGLGYYSRARNLHFSAKYILEYYDGVFPKSYNEILKLKGVGTYTAAAIASFAFELPYAVVDGNVVRVLSRVFGIQLSFDTSSAKKEYQNIAQKLLDKKNPAENNQAIMDFGALHCTYRSPKCNSCPFGTICVAFTTNSIEIFPVKAKKIKIKKRYLHYLLIKKTDSVMLGKIIKGIWKGLYELPFLEYSSEKTTQSIIASNKWQKIFSTSDYKIESISTQYIHKLSHQCIYAKFWQINVLDFNLEKYLFLANDELKNYPVSRLTDKFFKDNHII